MPWPVPLVLRSNRPAGSRVGVPSPRMSTATAAPSSRSVTRTVPLPYSRTLSRRTSRICSVARAPGLHPQRALARSPHGSDVAPRGGPPFRWPGRRCSARPEHAPGSPRRHGEVVDPGAGRGRRRSARGDRHGLDRVHPADPGPGAVDHGGTARWRRRAAVKRAGYMVARSSSWRGVRTGSPPHAIGLVRMVCQPRAWVCARTLGSVVHSAVTMLAWDSASSAVRASAWRAVGWVRPIADRKTHLYGSAGATTTPSGRTCRPSSASMASWRASSTATSASSHPCTSSWPNRARRS